jgi:hypothetical protein
LGLHAALKALCVEAPSIAQTSPVAIRRPRLCRLMQARLTVSVQTDVRGRSSNFFAATLTLTIPKREASYYRYQRPPCQAVPSLRGGKNAQNFLLWRFLTERTF